MAESVETTRDYEMLLSICKQITSHRQKIAKPKIDEVICRHIGMDLSNEQLLAHLIGESLLKRIDRQLLESKNIYVQQFDIPQIKLFYSMAQAIPFVSGGHFLANQYILSVVRDLKSFTLLDVGIGKGVQEEALFQMLETTPTKLEDINIIALDPVEKNLQDTRELLAKMQKDLKVRLKYYPLCNMVETLTDEDYRSIQKIGEDAIVINSTFTIHHTSHPLRDNQFRTNLLKKLAGLRPLLITLVEPNSNHDTEDLPKRFHNAWHHFKTVYRMIDEADIDPSHKFSIKIKFFGREIRDIFGVSDYFRCERHEPYDSWLLKLSKAGFRPVDLKDLRIDLPAYCDFNISEGLVRLNYDDINIVSVFGYHL